MAQGGMGGQPPGGPSMTNMDMANPASRGAWGAPMPQQMPGGFGGGLDPAKQAAMAAGPVGGFGPSMNQNLWRLPQPAMRANDPMPRPGGMMAPMPMPAAPVGSFGEVRAGNSWQPMPAPQPGGMGAPPPGLLGGMMPPAAPAPQPRPAPAPPVGRQLLAGQQSRPAPQPARANLGRALFGGRR